MNTVKRYARFLEISYQVVLLRPLLPTVSARLVKSPKLYWTEPPSLHFFRTHAGREVDFVLHAPDRVVAIEVKAGQRAHRTDARPLSEVLGTLAIRGGARDAWRLGLVVTSGREVEPLGPGVWPVPDWCLFGPAG